MLECPSGFFEMPLYEPAHMTDVSCRSLQSDSERTHTLSPILSRSTFEPTATTTPAPSSPRSTGNVVVYNPVSWIFQSSGFKPAASTLSRTSSGPGEGTLTVRTAKAPPFDRRWSTFCWRGRDIVRCELGLQLREHRRLYILTIYRSCGPCGSQGKCMPGVGGCAAAMPSNIWYGFCGMGVSHARGWSYENVSIS